MNKRLLAPAVQEFLRSRLGFDPAKLALETSNFEGIEPGELARQLNGLQRSREKLPTWHKNPSIYYPPNLNLEQTSSETTARYKAGLVSGKNGIDLSGGFGVDSFFLSDRHIAFTYCERDEELYPIAAHNLEQLGAKNLKAVRADGIKHLKESGEMFDTIFVDPSRRSDVKGKVFRLEDCSPDLTEHMPLLREKGRLILVKTSPLLDLQMGIRQLKDVKRIHVLAVNNEVKELLWECGEAHGPIEVHTRNWYRNGVQEFDFQLEDESRCEADYTQPMEFLYEPNAAVLKSGAFCMAGSAFNLKKIGKHSHLYTGSGLIDYPGRVFRVVNSYPFSKKSMNRHKLPKANLSTRNFPLSVAELRKRFKIRDGGEDYLFFTTLEGGEKYVIHAKKI